LVEIPFDNMQKLSDFFLDWEFYYTYSCLAGDIAEHLLPQFLQGKDGLAVMGQYKGCSSSFDDYHLGCGNEKPIKMYKIELVFNCL